MKRIYLDYAATTPVRKEVIKAMIPYFGLQFGNPGSLHSFGQEAMGAVDFARESTAGLLETSFRSVLFCGSATEANNLILKGLLHSWKRKEKPRILISSIEHESIFETVRVLEERGEIELCIVSVNEKGGLNINDLKSKLSENTILVSVMYINNEIGAVQDLKSIADAINAFKNKHPGSNILFHSDCVQAFSYFSCSLEEVGADAITLSAHKCGGPKGVGVLAFSKSKEKEMNTLHPIVVGGGQEFGFRSGTENVANIVGCARAFEIAGENRKKEVIRLKKIKKYFEKEILSLFPQSVIYSDPNDPHIVNVGIRGISAEEFLTQCDLLSVALSSGAACSARSHTPSHVLSAIGSDSPGNGIRASFGYMTTQSDIREVMLRLRKVFGKKK